MLRTHAFMPKKKKREKKNAAHTCVHAYKRTLTHMYTHTHTLMCLPYISALYRHGNLPFHGPTRKEAQRALYVSALYVSALYIGLIYVRTSTIPRAYSQGGTTCLIYVCLIDVCLICRPYIGTDIYHSTGLRARRPNSRPLPSFSSSCWFVLKLWNRRGVCVCVCVCGACVHIYTCTHAPHTHTHTHTCMHACIYMYTHARTHNMSYYMYKCMHVYMYTHTHTHSRTHTHSDTSISSAGRSQATKQIQRLQVHFAF